jgi:hypothetical protein
VAASEATELTDDGAQDEIAPATPRSADAAAFEWVLVVRVRVAGDAAATATGDSDGGAAAQVAEKRIVFGDEQQQMSLLSKLIVETIQIDQLRVRV